MKGRLLDTYCGAGGATRGYQLAGYHVTGVDIAPQPNYCGDDLIEASALELNPDWIRDNFDVVVGSPPCQHYANVTRWTGDQDDHPALIGWTRDLFVATGLPYVIENVRTTALHNPTVLCGSMFGLRVIRHRYFESNVDLPFLVPACDHSDALPFMHKGERAYADAMGCDWMSAKEAREAIPPAYTEWIGTWIKIRAVEVVA